MEDLRKDFAIFKKHKNLIYFDNSASTFKPKSVVSAVNYYNENLSTNSGRSVYKLGYETTCLIEKTREKIARFFKLDDLFDVVFTKNTTEAINLVANGFVKTHLKAGDEIIVSVMEHHSNLLPYLELEKQLKVKVVFVPLSKDYKITLKNFEKVLTDKTKFVALNLVSNTLGYLIDAKKIVELAHKKGAKVLLDGAQAVSHFDVDIKDLDCDFFALSGYKIYAPSGVGVLIGKKHLLSQTYPTNFGGGMVLDASFGEVEYKTSPEKFEGGTLAIGSILGLGAAIDYLESVGRLTLQTYEKKLKDYFFDKMSSLDGVELYGSNPDAPIFMFNIKGLHAHDVATMYDEYNICVRAGHHCAQNLIKTIGQVATVRASLAFYNTKEEIDTFLEATKKIVEFVKSFER